MCLRREEEQRGTKHVFTSSLRWLNFLIFSVNILLCSSLLQTKNTTLEKTKSYKRWIFWVGSLGPALAALFKPNSAPCIDRTGLFLVGLGDGPGCKILAGAGGIFCSSAAAAACLWRRVALFPCVAQLRSLGWVWRQFPLFWLIFCSFSDRNLLAAVAKKCHGRQRRCGSRHGAMGGSAGPTLSQGLCST